MFDLQQIIEFDKETLLTLNSNNSFFLDGFMWIYTGMIIWFPLAIGLLYIIIKNNKVKESILIICMIGLVILLADRISSGFFKPFYQRFRPTQDPEIMYLIDIVNGYRGGRYGFVSSHAANSFGILTFICLLLRKKEFTYAILGWAIINCYSRIYLGVHYTGDIIAGALLGFLSGYLVYLLYRFISTKYFPVKTYFQYSNKYTQTGYLKSDIQTTLTILYSTFFIILIIGMFFCLYKFI